MTDHETRIIDRIISDAKAMRYPPFTSYTAIDRHFSQQGYRVTMNQDGVAIVRGHGHEIRFGETVDWTWEQI